MSDTSGEGAGEEEEEEGEEEWEEARVRAPALECFRRNYFFYSCYFLPFKSMV